MSKGMLSAALCLVLVSLFAVLAPTVSLASDFSGQWSGTWRSDDEEGYSGPLTGNFVQSGGTLTGTLTLGESECGSFIDIPLKNGIVVGNAASFDVSGYCADPEVADDITVQLAGTLTDDVYSGNYWAFITSSGDAIDTGTFSVKRSSSSLEADFTADVTSGTAPLTVNFTSISQGQISTFSWTFGDGGTSNLQNPSHTYNTAGTYTVSLTVSGSGGTDTETKTNYINVEEAVQAPVADFSGSPTVVFAGESVDFTDLSSGAITNWSWTFEGGTPPSSTQRHPTSVFYLLPGTYTVTLSVIGPGGSDTETKTGYITVQDPRPVADFNANPISGTAPLSVQFTSLSTGNINSYKWDFGDGQTSNEKDPLHVYQNPGIYTVSLEVKGPVPSFPQSQGTKTKTNYITVTAPPPVAKLTANPLHGAAPLEVQFTDQSTGNITSRSWNFGGGSQIGGGEWDPRVRYDNIGNYTVTLNVTGPGGSSNAVAQVLVYQIIYVNKNDATCGGKSPCRTSLQTAFNDAAQCALIKVTQDTYLENLSLTSQQQKIVMFQGGYNAAFDSFTGFTAASQMSLGGGLTLIAERLQLQGGTAALASAVSTEGAIVHSSGTSSTSVSDGSRDRASAAESSATSSPSMNHTSGGKEGSGSGLYENEANDNLASAIERIYKAALGRDPAPHELEGAADYAIAISRTYGAEIKYALWDIASSLFAARPCRGRECLSEEAISSAYRAMLGREAFPEERIFWLKVASGIESVIYAAVGSAQFMEAHQSLMQSYEFTVGNSVCASYIALLDRLPRVEEFYFWGGMPLEDIIAGILDSHELKAKNLSVEEIQLRLLLLENDLGLGIN